MNKNYKAFSLSELMIVLVVIALLFSALAPVITKRHIAETHENESIWNYITGDADRNSFFDPGNEQWTSSVYIGAIPTSANNNAGKLVVDTGSITINNENYWMPQMQFRFSKSPSEQGRGINAANLFYNGDDSIIFGSSMAPYRTASSVVYGLANLPYSPNSYGYTVMGTYAMGNAKINMNSSSTNKHDLIAVGHRALYELGNANSANTVNGIYIGSNAGSGAAESNVAPSDNIAIGYKSMSSAGNIGNHNVFVGAFTGNGFTDSNNSSYNTILGSNFSRASASYNTIIGYGAYDTGEPVDENKRQVKAMTAIGYAACNSLYGSNDGSRICIGYSSGQSSNNTPDTYSTDSGEHIFLGGKPISSTDSRGFSGRSILEIHNNSGLSGTYGNVVINSNLVVRGNFYSSDADGVISYNRFYDTQSIEAEDSYYRCSSDSYNSILTFNAYVCRSMALSNPKSINLLYKGGNCSMTNGYPNGSGCPNIITSDIRLKENLSENNDGIDKIVQLKPFNYTYKNKPNIIQTGVIAQDLQKVFPNSVTKDKNGFLSIKWEDIFYALVNSIKQLAAKLDNIIAMVDKSENEIKIIKKDQKDINNELSRLEIRIRKLERK